MWSVGHLAGQFVERLVSQLLGGNTADRCVGARPATTDPLVHARSLTADLVGKSGVQLVGCLREGWLLGDLVDRSVGPLVRWSVDWSVSW